MQIGLRLLCFHVVTIGFFQLHLQIKQLTLSRGQSTFLVRQTFRCSAPLGCGIGGQLLIGLLALLLLHLVFVHFQLQVIAQHVQEVDNTVGILLAVGRLHEGVGLLHALLLGELLGLGLLVLLWVIELVQTVLGELQQLQSSLVLGRFIHVGLVLGLALLGGGGHGLVQLLNALIEVCDLRLVGLDGILIIGDMSFHALDLDLDLLNVVFHLVDLVRAIRLLGVVVLLLGVELIHHAIDHPCHLLHPLLLAAESQSDQIQVDTAPVAFFQSSQRSAAHLLGGHLHLQQAGGGN
mmetsp:Transcript_19767/g.43889  ORF Transcript_19767/g.43889 Transcript_19767/m.43889 type:complete len:293 (-) Transcript_19767:25-903(-)